VWKREVTQKVLQKRGMKKISIKSTLRSAKREGVKKYEMKLRSTKRGGGVHQQMHLSHWKTPGVSERIWSVNLEVSISGEFWILGGLSSWHSK
jgi:hypothetical protein